MVSEFELKKVPISIIKFDETNPNVLSDEQMSALKLTMEKYGYLSPVILNKDFTVIDGEHRVRIYQELEKQEIPAYVLDVDIIDQKILRQLMNKLRGEHDSIKDKEEFIKIFEAKKLQTFADLLGKPVDDFLEIIKGYDDFNDIIENTTLEDEVNAGFTIGFKFENEKDYELCVKKLREFDTENMERAFVKLVRYANKH